MNFKRLTYLLAISITAFNCSNSSSDDLMTDPDPTPTVVSYDANIKSIMSSNCTSCHGSTPTNGAPMSLTTYTQVKNAVENRGLISRINSVSSPMPTGGLMPKATRDLVQAWKDGGFIEN